MLFNNKQNERKSNNLFLDESRLFSLTSLLYQIVM